MSRLFGAHSTQALIATKSCVAIIVGYALALRFDWDASSVATTIVVLQTAALGTTLSKAAARMAGTLVGAVAGMALVACCAHDRQLFFIAMALLTGVCVWGMQTSRHQYAWMLVVVTGAVVGWPSAMNPLNAFQTTVDRVTAVTLGVLISSLAHGLFWPVTASKQFERTMAQLTASCRELLVASRRGCVERNLDGSNIDKLSAKSMALANSLASILQAARSDSQRFRKHYSAYRDLADKLLDLSIAAVAIADASERCCEQANGSHLPEESQLLESLDVAIATITATGQQLSQARDGSAAPARSADERHLRLESNSATEPQDISAALLLDYRIRTFCDASIEVTNRLRTVEVKTSRPEEALAKPPAPAVRTRFAKSALASVQVYLAIWYFVSLSWPLGLQAAMIPVMVIAYLNAQMPVVILARTMLLSIAAALPLGAVFNFLVMPGIDSFAELSPWLALFFFPFLYGIASRNPMTSMASIIAVLISKALLQLSTTPPNYDFAVFANTYLGMGGGFALVLFLAYLFNRNSPRRGFHKLLGASIHQVAENLNASTDQSDHERPIAEPDKQLLGAVGKLRKLSGTVNYQQDPTIGRDKIAAIVRAYETLILRLAWADMPSSSRGVTEQQHESLTGIREWCSQSLAAAGRAVISFEAIEFTPFRAEPHGEDSVEVPDSASSREESYAAGQAYTAARVSYLSLVDAVLDFRTTLESVNWKRWCWDHF